MKSQNAAHLSRSLTNVIVGCLFWLVLLFSLLLRDEITVEAILFDLGKSLVVAGLAFFLLVIINDALVKSMVAAAKHRKVDRFRGGLSYHLAEPGPEELSWRKKYGHAHPDFHTDVERELSQKRK